MPTILPYSTRSEFFDPIEAAIRAAGGVVSVPLRIELKPGGYARGSRVLIRRDEPRYFETDWESKQPTRFSARCRAAATMLQRTGNSGWFRIQHDDGTLVIEPD